MSTFKSEIARAQRALQHNSTRYQSQTWQGVDISRKPEMAMHEVRFFTLNAVMHSESYTLYQQEIEPNIPWADNHFEERVCGQPINPGHQWKHWPHGNSASKFLTKQGKFNHNYMERYWPKHAGQFAYPLDLAEDYKYELDNAQGAVLPNEGIYHEYGDLQDVVQQLHRDPFTRQAILPVFFPEDTGAVHKGRVPCTIAYQFMMRNHRLHIFYYIRSCDFMRHFRDDIYLTVRLNLWMLDQLRKMDKHWYDVKPGDFSMFISSLHCFANDYIQLFGGKNGR